MEDWMFTQPPVRKAFTLDFGKVLQGANGTPMVANQSRSDTLQSVEKSAGDWTLYLIRQVPDTFDATSPISVIDTIEAQVGYGESQDSQVITDINQTAPAFWAWGGRNRAQLLHFHGETVQVRVNWNAPAVIGPNAFTQADRLVAWISPSRPTRYEIPFIASVENPVMPPPYTMTVPPLRVPIWSTHLLAHANAFDVATQDLIVPAPVWVCFFDFNDTPITLGPACFLLTPGEPIPVPTDARWVRFVRPVAVAGTTSFVSGVFVCYS